MNNLTCKTVLISATLAAVAGGPANAGMPHVFNTGDPARASEVNTNFDSLDTRVSALEARGGGSGSPGFGGYSTPFSAVGAPRNVIVLARDNGDGSVAYSLRVRYQSDTETISVNGVETPRTFFAAYPWVDVNAGGDIDEISNWIDSPDTADYTSYLGEGSTYDVDSLTRTVYADDERFTDSCGASPVVLICASVRTSSADGSFLGMSDSSFVREILSDVTVAGETFSSLRAEKLLREDGRFRLRAKGIGLVYDARNGQAPLELVYYHVNGVSEGSLDGTPFAPGARLDGLFF